MGRYIDLNKPLSDEDRAYLESRSRHGEIAANDRRFGHLDEEERETVTTQVDEDNEHDEQEAEAIAAAIQQEEEESFPDHLIEKVAPLSTQQLRSALEKRGQDTSGDKRELQVRLLQYLEEKEKQG